jgi:hypothetical protein
MTVSAVALEPRWWPAQPGGVLGSAGRERGRGGEGGGTVLRRAVLIRVVAAEDDAGAVGTGNFVQPADDGGGGADAEVFLEDLGGVAVDENCRRDG